MRDYVMVDGRLHVRMDGDRWGANGVMVCEVMPVDGGEPRWVPRDSIRFADLTEVLTGLGYTSLPDHDGPVSSARRTILRDGVVVFTGRAWAVWEWLREVQP